MRRPKGLSLRLIGNSRNFIELFIWQDLCVTYHDRFATAGFDAKEARRFARWLERAAKYLDHTKKKRARNK